jgi:hypothetical protein
MVRTERNQTMLAAAPSLTATPYLKPSLQEFLTFVPTTGRDELPLMRIEKRVASREPQDQSRRDAMKVARQFAAWDA